MQPGTMWASGQRTLPALPYNSLIRRMARSTLFDDSSMIVSIYGTQEA